MALPHPTAPQTRAFSTDTWTYNQLTSSFSPSSSNGADNSDDSSAASSANAPDAFLKRIVENKIQLKSKSFPSCFYADGSYDPQDLDKGLLRGDVIPRVLRHLWMGPSSGIPGVEGKLPKGCNALAHNVFRVSPEMIGYAACQARTMLGTKDWTERDGEYDYIELFNKVVKLFADPEDDWAKETLDWFQNELFGDAAAPVPQANDDEDSDEEDVMAQPAYLLSFMNGMIVFRLRRIDLTASYAAFTPFFVAIIALIMFLTDPAQRTIKRTSR
ncbi:hypothetical protein B0H13DRAFT_2290984 [Mycena leptocephala]|nr:hypothetical protein B0H13DRAFT_2290984 [Mycena leptocephala]